MAKPLQPILLLLHPVFLSLTCYLFFSFSSANFTIGVNYGINGDNLPPPSKVAQFLKNQTIINRVKIFDADADILTAFANTGIPITITIGNGDIPSLSKMPAAQSWIAVHVLPFHPKTIINCIVVGNEVVHNSNKSLIDHLLPAMKSLHQALKLANITSIQVSTAHAMDILSSSYPPSSGKFQEGYDRTIVAPILEFHRQTKSAFMVNPYPYYGFLAGGPDTLNYALFKPNNGVVDQGLHYSNMFDAQMDALFSAMKKVGYDDVDIVVGETGWPSAGDPNQTGVSKEHAMSFNGNLIKHVNSGKGTPLMPNRTFEVYIFGLFNENMKPTVEEQNYGLFKPDFTPVYDAGVLKTKRAPGPTSSSPTSAPGPTSSSPISAPGPTSSTPTSAPGPTTPYSRAPTSLSPTSSPPVDKGHSESAGQNQPSGESGSMKREASLVDIGAVLSFYIIFKFIIL